MIHRLSAEELEQRQNALRAVLEANELAGAYLTHPVSIFYVTGFHMVATERPAALLMPLKGDPGFVGPRLEEGHVLEEGGTIGLVRTYFDYPGETHPMDSIAQFLTELGLGKGRIGTDNPAGCADQWGYEGPRLCDLLPRVEFVEIGEDLSRLRRVKSSEEIALIRESCRWADTALACLKDETAPGVWDVEAGLGATLVATRAMKKALGEEFKQAVSGLAPVSAGYRGQVGPSTAIPHAFATHRRLEAGFVLGSGAIAEVGGYHCELERTLVLGPPTEKQARAFEIMVRAQDAAIAALQPGAPCGNADLASYRVFEEAGEADRTLHHSGHGLGLEFHEPPFLDRGESEPLRPGMVFAVEPGIYFPGFAGFRHSDTVLVTEEGCEILTASPRDLEGCTIPIKKGRKRKAAKQGPVKKAPGKKGPSKKAKAAKKKAGKKAPSKKATGKKGRKGT